jgi:hypothetical protein
VVAKRPVQAKKRAAKEQRARLDELKRRQRAAERRRTAVTIAAGLAVGALLIAAVTFLRWNPTRAGYVANASKAAKKAGCTGVRNDRARDRQAVSAPVTYRDSPPSSGRYNPDPLPETPAFLDRTIKTPRLTERAVANLARGFVIGWYDSSLPAAEVAKLKTAATATSRFLAVPWTGKALPGGRPFVLTAWARTQRCKTVSPDVLTAFATTYTNYKTAPESGGAGGSAITPKPSAGTGKKPAPSPSR